MALITVTGAAEDAAIAADAGRTYMSFRLQKGSLPVRWSFGATYSTTSNELLEPGEIRAFTGATAQLAVSFKVADAPTGFVETTLYP